MSSRGGGGGAEEAGVSIQRRQEQNVCQMSNIHSSRARPAVWRWPTLRHRWPHRLSVDGALSGQRRTVLLADRKNLKLGTSQELIFVHTLPQVSEFSCVTRASLQSRAYLKSPLQQRGTLLSDETHRQMGGRYHDTFFLSPTHCVPPMRIRRLSRPALVTLLLTTPGSSFRAAPFLHCNRLIFPRHTNRLMASLASSALTPTRSSLPMIDIGANLLDDMFKGCYGDKQRHPSDFDLMLQRSVKGLNAGVGEDGTCSAIIITAGTLTESKETAVLAKSLNERCLAAAGPASAELHLLCEADRSFAAGTKGRRLFSTAGLHPTRAGEMFTDADPTGTVYIEALSAFIEEQQGEARTIVALGELGLDVSERYLPTTTRPGSHRLPLCL